MSDIEKKARVLMTPVQEYDRNTIDTLLRCMTGKGLNQFVQEVFQNQELYDKIISEKGEISHADQ